VVILIVTFDVSAGAAQILVVQFGDGLTGWSGSYSTWGLSWSWSAAVFLKRLLKRLIYPVAVGVMLDSVGRLTQLKFVVKLCRLDRTETG
jgi:hypothetical protein